MRKTGIQYQIPALDSWIRSYEPERYFRIEWERLTHPILARWCITQKVSEIGPMRMPLPENIFVAVLTAPPSLPIPIQIYFQFVLSYNAATANRTRRHISHSV